MWLKYRETQPESTTLILAKDLTKRLHGNWSAVAPGATAHLDNLPVETSYQVLNTVLRRTRFRMALATALFLAAFLGLFTCLCVVFPLVFPLLIQALGSVGTLLGMLVLVFLVVLLPDARPRTVANALKLMEERTARTEEVSAIGGLIDTLITIRRLWLMDETRDTTRAITKKLTDLLTRNSHLPIASLMTVAQRAKLAQIVRTYGTERRAEYPENFLVASMVALAQDPIHAHRLALLTLKTSGISHRLRTVAADLWENPPRQPASTLRD